MSNPHLRINCTDPPEDSCPGRIREIVLAPSRIRLSKPSCHRSDTTTVTFPQTNASATRVRTMGQSYPPIRLGPEVNPPIYPPFLVPSRRGLPKVRIPKSHLFFSFSVYFFSSYFQQSKKRRRSREERFRFFFIIMKQD